MLGLWLRTEGSPLGKGFWSILTAAWQSFGQPVSSPEKKGPTTGEAVSGVMYFSGGKALTIASILELELSVYTWSTQGKEDTFLDMASRDFASVSLTFLIDIIHNSDKVYLIPQFENFLCILGTPEGN